MKFYITDQTRVEIENRIRSINKNMHEMAMLTFHIDIDKSVGEKDRKELEMLEKILSNSAPIIPEIEKAFDEGQNRMQHEIIEKLGLRYQTEQVSQSTILNMEVHSEDYISNLKLDI